MARSAFPDLHAIMEDVLSDGNKVIGRIVWHGTQRGGLTGVEPTGKQVAFAAIHIVRFEERKAVEWWGIADPLGAVEQLQLWQFYLQRHKNMIHPKLKDSATDYTEEHGFLH